MYPCMKGFWLLRSAPDLAQDPEGKYEALAKYARDLTAAARDGKLDPVIGRDDEIRRAIQILSRRTKNNPVLIGEPGVGKTAVAEGAPARACAPLSLSTLLLPAVCMCECTTCPCTIGEPGVGKFAVAEGTPAHAPARMRPRHDCCPSRMSLWPALFASFIRPLLPGTAAL